MRLCHQRRLEQLSPIPTAANLGELYEHITTGSEHDILPEFILHHRPWASSTETKLHLLGVLFMVAFLTSNVFARFLLSVLAASNVHTCHPIVSDRETSRVTLTAPVAL
jgi:hypothetical protein